MVIPALNESENIGNCLNSLQAQTRRADEIIVVDNGSEDDTVEIARSFGARILSYLRPDLRFGNIGLVRQTGVEAARGDVIVSTDADMTHPTDWLEKIESQFTSNPQLVMLGGPVYPYARNFLKDLETGIYNFHRSYWTRWGIPLFYGANTSFRKIAFLKSGGYRGFGAHGPVEEIIVGFRLSRVGDFMWNDDIYCYSMR